MKGLHLNNYRLYEVKVTYDTGGVVLVDDKLYIITIDEDLNQVRQNALEVLRLAGRKDYRVWGIKMLGHAHYDSTDIGCN